MAKKKAQKKGKKKIRAFGSVDPFMFRVKTNGTSVVDIDEVWPPDEAEETDDDTSSLSVIIEVTLVRFKVSSVVKTAVIGSDSSGNTRAWIANTPRMKLYLKDAILLVKDGKGKKVSDVTVPSLGTNPKIDRFVICEGPGATTCRYVVQGGVAKKICS